MCDATAGSSPGAGTDNVASQQATAAAQDHTLEAVVKDVRAKLKKCKSRVQLVLAARKKQQEGARSGRPVAV